MKKGTIILGIIFIFIVGLTIYVEVDKYGNKISSTNLDYWYSVNDMIENVEDRFNEELAIALQSFGL